MKAVQSAPRVLVIDDDPVMRELLKVHLEAEGYEVLVAEDGVAGGRLVLSNDPNLVVVDVDMPFMSGYDLVKAMKSDPGTCDIPVLFLTSDRGVARLSRELGAEAYILKPLRAERLLAVVALFT